ncbi:KpsF/GutQ family sugar-phosphate isomerase [Kiloniella sp. b19]|uniref:KpsF/GutQ family sugar-phosphate isomerase n=1 Tax=Kiloniella sp. GXU_MW_B19 TaxID=3141326 RepID=UPI0031D43291
MNAPAQEKTITALESAQRLIKTEGNALLALRDSLNGDFESAVETLMQIRGRVIVSGMGKSGHIGKKIAATMASTGTPAYFVHPGEASHGDLGMITQDDAVLALSNSGNTAELTDLLTYTRRYSIPLIAITSGAGSALAKTADIALILPPEPEGCPLGLAPTTSTTMTLVLGDALAIALLECKQFKATDFKVFHPGGSLGKQLVRVRDIMHSGESIPLCQPGAAMSEVLLSMTSCAFGCIGVQGQKGELVGIITDGDLRRHMDKSLLDQSASDIMTANPRSISADALAAEALGIMNERSITSLFVTDDDNCPAGIIHIHDCLRAGLN